MFIQQPFRVEVESIRAQETPVLLDNAVRRHYINKGREQSTDVVSLMHVDVVNGTLVGSATQVDVLLGIEADTIEFFNQFILYFIEDESTDTLRIRRID